MFITFEGGEGVGKSTQVRLLVKRLALTSPEVVQTREPGGTPFAELVRSFILGGKARHLGPAAEARFFAIARREHVGRLIRPALDRGAIVVCDRFIDSTRALQGAGGVSDEILDDLEIRAAGDCMPDLTIMLFAPENKVSSRRRERGVVDRFEGENDEFHRKVVGRFSDIAARHPRRIVEVDADGDVDAVHDRIWSVLIDRMASMLDEEPSSVHREFGEPDTSRSY